MHKSWKGFYRLLHRYQNGTINPIKKQVMDFWYDSINHAKADDVPAENLRLKADMWNTIRQRMYEKPEVQESFVVKRWWQSVSFRFAATALFLISSFIFYKAVTERRTIIAEVPDSVISALVQQVNNSQKLKLIKLSDGSEVSLYPGSILFYPEVFNAGERKVFLKGDGFFDVAHDRSKPFLVYSDHIITKVVGTSFTIKRNSRSGIEVSVLTGLVKVRENLDYKGTVLTGREVTLTPNKKVTFSPDSREMITGLVKEPIVVQGLEGIAYKTDRFNYNDTPVSTIIAQLEKAYGVSIVSENKNLANCSITADASNIENLFEVLDILCAAIDASYEVKGEQIFLNGPGCKPI